MRFISQGKLCPSLDCDHRSFLSGQRLLSTGVWGEFGRKRPFYFYLCFGISGCNGRNNYTKRVCMLNSAPSINHGRDGSQDGIGDLPSD
jgi:hypothetical protein